MQPLSVVPVTVLGVTCILQLPYSLSHAYMKLRPDASSLSQAYSRKPHAQTKGVRDFVKATRQMEHPKQANKQVRGKSLKQSGQTNLSFMSCPLASSCQ